MPNTAANAWPPPDSCVRKFFLGVGRDYDIGPFRTLDHVKIVYSNFFYRLFQITRLAVEACFTEGSVATYEELAAAWHDFLAHHRTELYERVCKLALQDEKRVSLLLSTLIDKT